MTPTGVPSSVAGLAFSPHFLDSATGFGMLQVSSWQGQNIYNVPLTPTGDGIFAPGTAERFVSLPQQGTGAIQYVPRGIFAGNLMYVNWNYGEVRMVVIDRESGLPIDEATGLPTLGTTTPEDIRFAHDMGVGPWGLEFDPLTLDFFVTTWQGNPSNAIIQFTGAGFLNHPPVAQGESVTTPRDTPVAITLDATDADNDPLTFSVVETPTHGTLGGVPPDVVYTPDADYIGPDQFTFRASDGRDVSETASVNISVLGQSAGDGDASIVADADATTPPDATVSPDSTTSPDAGASPDAGPSAADASMIADIILDEGCDCRATHTKKRGAGLPWSVPNAIALLSTLFIFFVGRSRPARPSASQPDRERKPRPRR